MQVDEGGRVVDELGRVAVRRMHQSPRHVKVNGNDYLFRIQHNISLAWIEPEDVEAVLSIRDRSCCNKPPKRINSLADETHARRWMYGGR